MREAVLLVSASLAADEIEAEEMLEIDEEEGVGEGPC